MSMFLLTLQKDDAKKGQPWQRFDRDRDLQASEHGQIVCFLLFDCARIKASAGAFANVTVAAVLEEPFLLMKSVFVVVQLLFAPGCSTGF